MLGMLHDQLIYIKIIYPACQIAKEITYITNYQRKFPSRFPQ